MARGTLIVSSKATIVGLIIPDGCGRHARVDGGPDRRFRDNYQTPIVRYAELRFRAEGFEISLQVSSVQCAKDFVRLWDEVWKSSDKQSGKQKPEEKNYQEKAETNRAKHSMTRAHGILGVTASATFEEITRAYYGKAKQYHPDRVQGLGPEFHALAEERMKEVNAAYETLRRIFGPKSS